MVEYWRKKKSKELIFKAPTGSGKTFMMAQVIDKMISLRLTLKNFSLSLQLHHLQNCQNSFSIS
ncbi:DEAD/DEAH box helicase family protein [Mycoplasmopsis synoviae]|uniref:DEAD/DEAH box helicase family protein n=1 Tax=Mycoplasmopsis synoviae TaxID=2109 RepID=UPI0012A9C9E9|nr:hypothetical protein EJ916_02465 [Mycoplasmopsis synoviae]